MRSAFWPPTLYLCRVKENSVNVVVVLNFYLQHLSNAALNHFILSYLHHNNLETPTLTSVYCMLYFPLKSVLCQITDLCKFTYNLLSIIFYQLYGGIISNHKLHPFRVYRLMSFDRWILGMDTYEASAIMKIL